MHRVPQLPTGTQTSPFCRAHPQQLPATVPNGRARRARPSSDRRLAAGRSCLRCQAAQSDGQGLFGLLGLGLGLQSRSSAGAKQLFDPLPRQLLATEQQGSPATLAATGQPLTVYSIRLVTSSSPGSSLTEPFSAVNVLLVAKDGRSLMHRISPINDPFRARGHMHDICQVIDASVGINCDVIHLSAPLPTTTTSHGSDSPSASAAAAIPRLQPPAFAVQPKLRFQRGQVDEVSFLAPELGALAGILIGTESGCWGLDEADVSSSRTAHTDRFVCRSKLGVDAGQGARWLVPLPDGAFVYGSGEKAVVLTKEDANTTLRAMKLALPETQSCLLVTTLLLAAAGSALAGLAAGAEAALPFAFGVVLGVLADRVDFGALWDSENISSSLSARPGTSGSGRSEAGVHFSGGSTPAASSRGSGARAGPNRAMGGRTVPAPKQPRQPLSDPIMRALPAPQPPLLPFKQQGGNKGAPVAGTGGASRWVRQQPQQPQPQPLGRPGLGPVFGLGFTGSGSVSGSGAGAGAGFEGSTAGMSEQVQPSRDGRPLVTTGVSSRARQQYRDGRLGKSVLEPTSESGGTVLPTSLATCAALVAFAALQGDAGGVGAGIVGEEQVAAMLQDPYPLAAQASSEALVSELQALVSALQAQVQGLVSEQVVPWWLAVQEGLLAQSAEQTALQLVLAALGYATNKVAAVELLLADDDKEEH